MSRTILYLAVLLYLAQISYAQVRVIKPVKTHPERTNLSIGLGMSNSVVFLARNTNDHNNAMGLTTSLVYGSSKSFRMSLDYTHYGSINIAPTWYDVRANTVEANMQVMYKSKGKLYFYPLFGLSYNVFSGYFTGKDDYLNLSSIYGKNQIVKTRWLGFNAGVGFEYAIKPVIIFAGYKMRVGVSAGNNALNILDVCYSFGLRYNLVVPSVYNLFKGTRRRYFIDKQEEL